jgi:hypothetical protein
MAAGVTGQTIGGLIGAGVGSQTGLGSAQGTQLGAGIGGLLGSRVDRKKSEQATPGLVDPLEQARLAELSGIQKAISTGSDVVTQSNIDQVRNVGATVGQQLSRVTGGDVGGTISGLLKAQKQTQAGIGQAVAQSQQRLPFFQNMFQQLGTRVSQRKLELGLLNRSQSLAESAQSGKDATQNLLSFAATQGSLPSLGSTTDKQGGLLLGGGGSAKGAEAGTEVPSTGVLDSLREGGLGSALTGPGSFGGIEALSGAAAPATGGASLLAPLLLKGLGG